MQLLSSLSLSASFYFCIYLCLGDMNEMALTVVLWYVLRRGPLSKRHALSLLRLVTRVMFVALSFRLSLLRKGPVVLETEMGDVGGGTRSKLEAAHQGELACFSGECFEE